MWAVWGTSPGKRAMKLGIVDADTGAPLTARQAAARTFGYLICLQHAARDFCGCGSIRANKVCMTGWQTRSSSTKRPLKLCLTMTLTDDEPPLASSGTGGNKIVRRRQ
jgi:hypothetical protein